MLTNSDTRIHAFNWLKEFYSNFTEDQKNLATRALFSLRNKESDTLSSNSAIFNLLYCRDTRVDALKWFLYIFKYFTSEQKNDALSALFLLRPKEASKFANQSILYWLLSWVETRAETFNWFYENNLISNNEAIKTLKAQILTFYGKHESGLLFLIDEILYRKNLKLLHDNKELFSVNGIMRSIIKLGDGQPVEFKDSLPHFLLIAKKREYVAIFLYSLLLS